MQQQVVDPPYRMKYVCVCVIENVVSRCDREIEFCAMFGRGRAIKNCTQQYTSKAA